PSASRAAATSWPPAGSCAASSGRRAARKGTRTGLGRPRLEIRLSIGSGLVREAAVHLQEPSRFGAEALAALAGIEGGAELVVLDARAERGEGGGALLLGARFHGPAELRQGGLDGVGGEPALERAFGQQLGNEVQGGAPAGA